MEKQSGLEKLKNQYKEFQGKYGLPDFKFLNENFEIESLAGEETELLLKKIRKQMIEKVTAGLRALEMFLNPQNTPLFIFPIIKNFSQTDKEIISQLHHELGEFEISSFGLENHYSEEAEAAVIKKVAEKWKDIADNFDIIFKSMKVNYTKQTKKNEKSYLG